MQDYSNSLNNENQNSKSGFIKLNNNSTFFDENSSLIQISKCVQ